MALDPTNVSKIGLKSFSKMGSNYIFLSTLFAFKFRPGCAAYKETDSVSFELFFLINVSYLCGSPSEIQDA